MRIECADKKSAKQHFCYSALFPHCPSGYGDIVFYCLINENRRFFGLFFFARLLKIGSKLWKEQPVFWKEQGDFGHFGVFEPLKSVLSAIV